VIAQLRSGELGERIQELPVVRACELLGANRSLVYRLPADRSGVEAEEARLMTDIERIVTRFPGYGYRRVTAQLVREGWRVNRKRVARLLGRLGLSCRTYRRRTRTTQSDHSRPVWPNLTRDLQVTSLNQLWVADITYVRLPGGFCYLACILDAHSRRVLGWELGRSLEASLALGALTSALHGRCPSHGFQGSLIHHSDRGVQYASDRYVQTLLEHGIQVSMSCKGAPTENARAESFFRTLKVEEVCLADYLNYEEAQIAIERFIDHVYNTKRLHSALGYVPPVEFEQAYARCTCSQQQPNAVPMAAPVVQ